MPKPTLTVNPRPHDPKRRAEFLAWIQQMVAKPDTTRKGEKAA